MPDLPAGCEDLQVPAGHQVSLHLYAQGYQIYQWSTTTNRWEFRGPTAFLYADPRYSMAIGLHFGGPTWMLNSDTLVRGEFVAGVTVDPTAIAWLKLRATASAGPGLLAETTYIQRLNTAGGKAPDRVGSPNETVWIPYTAEYWFYRAR
jgi:hypothetical protein